MGQVYEGTVLKLLDFGAIVNILPGKDGLLHISEIANERIKDINDYLKEGQQVKVKVIQTDEKGRVRLSAKALLNEGASTARRKANRRRSNAVAAATAGSVNRAPAVFYEGCAGWIALQADRNGYSICSFRHATQSNLGVDADESDRNHRIRSAGRPEAG